MREKRKGGYLSLEIRYSTSTRRYLHFEAKQHSNSAVDRARKQATTSSQISTVSSTLPVPVASSSGNSLICVIGD